jgi:hypothetical protein
MIYERLCFEVVYEAVIESFGNDIVLEIEEIVGVCEQVFFSEFSVRGPCHGFQIQSIEMIVDLGFSYAVAIDTIVEDINIVSKSESAPFDGRWDISFGLDEVPFVGFWVEGLEVSVGDELTITAQRHHFAIILKQKPEKIAAVVNASIETYG